MKKSNVVLTLIVVAIFLAILFVDSHPFIASGIIIGLGMIGSHIIHKQETENNVYDGVEPYEHIE